MMNGPKIRDVTFQLLMDCIFAATDSSRAPFFFIGLPKNEADTAEDKIRLEIELVDHDITNATTLPF
jgi:hypothetical protein